MSAARPVIGITTYRESVAGAIWGVWGVWDVSADVLPSDYARSVEAGGGVPVLLPPVDTAGAAGSVLGRLDGLVISGGADVDPQRYGATTHPQSSGWRHDRDAWELALLDAAEQRLLPTLGVCRGMQLMAVHGGGTLQQHVPNLVGHADHSPADDAFGSVHVRTTPRSVVRRLVGEELRCCATHHQAVATAPGYEVAARAADGSVEAMEIAERPFWLVVQWHPERQNDRGLFRGLVAAATST